MIAHSPKIPKPSWAEGLDVVFVDRAFLPAAAASVNPYAHVLSYGTGTFDGIRAFWNARLEQLFLLAPTAHYERLARSAAVLGLQLPHGTDQLVRLTAELLRRNGVRGDAYVRPLLVLGGAELSVRMHDVTPRFSLAASKLSGQYLAGGGIRCMVSSWRRCPDVAMPGRAKICGSYVGPALAKSEAVRHGFDEAIMLNIAGNVAEATTSNIFLRRGDRWITPAASEDILEGITRLQVMQLIAEESGQEVIERPVHRSELHVCEELFLCGTAAQVVPVVEVDSRVVGDGRPGRTATALHELLLGIARREIPRHAEWTTPVYEKEEK